jgi:hypothetical protein
MKFPTNSITVNKYIEDAFDLLISPDTYSTLLKNEYRVTIKHDKRTPPMEIGKTVKLIMPSEKGQIIADCVLTECMTPTKFRYDITSFNRKKKNMEEPLPFLMFMDKISIKVDFTETNQGTKVIFSTYIEGLKGFLTKTFAYIFFGIPSWFANRKYLCALKGLVNGSA